MFIPCLILFLLLFQSTFEKYLKFTYYDEMLTLVLIILLIFNIVRKKYVFKKNEARMLLCIIIFYVLGAISTMIYNYQNNIFLGLYSGFFSIKAFLAFFGMRVFLANSKFDINIIRKFLKIIELCMMISAILVFINNFIPIFPYSDTRYGIRTTSFIFTHPTELACYAIVSLLLCLNIRKILKIQKVGIWNYFSTGVLILFAGRAKAIGFFIILIFINLFLKFVRKFKVKHLILGAPVVIFFAREQIQQYLFDNTSARGALYHSCGKIAIEHFPLGTGFGTFGTEISRAHYSSVYYKYGLNRIWGLSPSYDHFIADTMWPGIIGETGFGGFIVIGFFFIELFKMIRKLSQKALLDRYTTWYLCSFLIYGLFESIADSIFMSSRGVLIFVAFAFVINMVEQIEKTYGKQGLYLQAMPAKQIM